MPSLLALGLAFPLGRRGPRAEVEAGVLRVAGGGFRKVTVRLEDVTLVYTTMMPKGEDFREVLAVEFSAPQGEGVLALDPAEGFDVAAIVAALREALGARWDDVYVGHKHLSRVRGL